MAIPAIQALTRRGSVTVYAPSWGPDLYRDLPVTVRPRGTMEGEVAVLMAPSLRAAWQARRCRRRIGTATDFRRALLTDPVPAHAATPATYRAAVEVLGVTVEGSPRWQARPSDPAPEVPEGHIGLNPISVSGAVREWGGFAALAARLPEPIVAYGGPGETRRVSDALPGCRQAVGLSLPAFARALSHCRAFVSNDSGAAHFAAACGVPTVVVFGSTTAARTGPAGCRAVEGPSLPCRPCYGRRCPHALECLNIPVDAVLAQVVEACGG